MWSPLKNSLLKWEISHLLSIWKIYFRLYRIERNKQLQANTSVIMGTVAELKSLALPLKVFFFNLIFSKLYIFSLAELVFNRRSWCIQNWEFFYSFYLFTQDSLFNSNKRFINGGLPSLWNTYKWAYGIDSNYIDSLYSSTVISGGGKQIQKCRMGFRGKE